MQKMKLPKCREMPDDLELKKFKQDIKQEMWYYRFNFDKIRQLTLEQSINRKKPQE